MKNNKKQKRNDFEYETLLKSEGDKINKLKHNAQLPSEDFQTSLKMNILEKRHEESNNMKKIFEIFTLPLKPKYSISAIALVLVFFIGLNFDPLPDKGRESIKDIVSFTTEKIPEKIAEKIVQIKDSIIKPQKEKVDDWQYAHQSDDGSFQGIFSSNTITNKLNSIPASLSETDSIGFAVGGAKDIDNFRQNVENNYLPLPTDITYEGLFYDYYFDTAKKEECKELFCPSYSYAISKDPFSENSEYYLSVGLNSNIKEADFQRKKLNLVVILDISGSMSSAFDEYYYDRFGNRVEVKDVDTGKSKIDVALESVVGLLDHLEDDDRFGMVLFNNGSYLAKPLNLVGETEMENIKDHILEIQANGGTNMSAGMKTGTELYEELLEGDQSEYENRIIFLTDAMPNLGDTSEDGLLKRTEGNSKDKLYSTFIGIGVDFNTELIEKITKIKGANYYSVHSSKEFKTRMDDEFEYMVTPLVFDLSLTLESEGYDIEKVYGSAEADEATGGIMKVNTLFPSSTEEGETKGGLVLLKLKKLSSDASLKLIVRYEDRMGTVESNEALVDIVGGPEYFENLGIRKGIVLARYVNLVKNWIKEQRQDYISPDPFFSPCVTDKIGILIPEFCGEPQLGRWERQSIPLEIHNSYKELFKEFKVYFEEEMKVIKDNTLSQEIDLLDKLINY